MSNQAFSKGGTFSQHGAVVKSDFFAFSVNEYIGICELPSPATARVCTAEPPCPAGTISRVMLSQGSSVCGYFRQTRGVYEVLM